MQTGKLRLWLFFYCLATIGVLTGCTGDRTSNDPETGTSDQQEASVNSPPKSPFPEPKNTGGEARNLYPEHQDRKNQRDIKKLDYEDKDAFDYLLKIELEKKRKIIVINTQSDELWDGRLNGWIKVWRDVNRDRKYTPEDISELIKDVAASFSNGCIAGKPCTVDPFEEISNTIARWWEEAVKAIKDWLDSRRSLLRPYHMDWGRWEEVKGKNPSWDIPNKNYVVIFYRIYD